MILRRKRLQRSSVPKRGGPLKRGKGPRRQRRTSKAAQGRTADRLFSLIVRHPGVCRYHENGSWADDWYGPGFDCSGALQCAHIRSRAYRSVRWSEDNAMPLCAAAHKYFTHHPLEWEDFVILRIGDDAFAELKQRALKKWDGDIESVLVRLAARAVALGIKP